MFAKVVVLSLLVIVVLGRTCNTAPQFPGDRRTNTDALTVVTYNAEWLFLANDQDPSSCPEAGCQYATLQEALAHVSDIADELREINADIVLLVEVEGCDVLDVLIEDIGASYGYVPYLVPGEDTYTGQNVAIITKIDPVQSLQRTDEYVNYPVANTACTGDFPSGSYGVSKNLWAKFSVNETYLNIFGVHFLAYPDDEERCFKREAQATVMANFMSSEVQRGEHVMIMGDFNDFDPDLVDTAGDVPISNVLSIIKGAFPIRFFGGDLVNVGSSVPLQSERYSSWYDKNDNCQYTTSELTAIDHNIVDPVLFKSMVESKYVHNYAPTCATAISDHFPVAAAYDYASFLALNKNQ